MNLNLNKTTCTYIIILVLKCLKISCLKRSAERDAQLSFYTCVIECVVVVCTYVIFTVNEATTSSY